MADIAKPSSPPLSASKNGTIISENSHKAKPEKPDEQLYEDAIAKAEREYTAAGEKVVRVTPISAELSTELHISTINTPLSFSPCADLEIARHNSQNQ